ncbi:uroporphyrinogen-III synthase [Hansschlegelia zhihuaiae]|uniref:Uroporphyrinogen-III synthase n=1 Tax=Hansschlegelia zhihuaiae TaxID=405005 RepID=A0A4Q0MIE0_9HYPH|nr:uroporphyrinogen-III synthase [Hansschlegelia zhihuaiae]RXF73135.1 uroporphyrinogen-III synthase [Hansschlegelia zhihuaiae]
MKVLVLRPERAARRTADALAALGHEAILAPVLTIEDLANPVPDGPFDAVLATSANGLRKLRSRPEIARLAGLPLIAVGDRTAEAGREAGFATVHVAEGDGRALVAEAQARFPKPARFLHAAGADRAFDIAGALARYEHETVVVELYRATAATELPEAAALALADGSARAALHHSRRIAETFLRLSDTAGFAETIRAMPHAALAARVAGALETAGCVRVAVAERPDEASLLQAVLSLVDDGSPYRPGRSN